MKQSQNSLDYLADILNAVVNAEKFILITQSAL
jgi:hypothetical protein